MYNTSDISYISYKFIVAFVKRENAGSYLTGERAEIEDMWDRYYISYISNI
jgi:hypothetical protein